ncbi:MAG: hypothetical protein A2X36_15715 [Elusimicrobia bacterium GWA2_69_24]|nr:MAG: hypothetical protein A2X36_15715 [Elusimicrobia bacterium GWA2_69_24]HBL18791.1 uracil-DNA glycosylase [Elusimicrobiota bacterium]
MSGAELSRLVRELRARAESTEPLDWGPSPAAGPASAAADAPPAAEALSRLKAQVEACRRCPLGATRLHPAFGVGSPSAAVLFIGEGPGREEDHRGEPFVGKAGQLLDKILESVGLSRETVYIANIVKCHPMVDPSDPEKRGNDRPPTPAETQACRGWLEEQIRILRPRCIVALGGVSAKFLLQTPEGISRLRGRWARYGPDGIPLMPTYHPAALLRDPGLKRDVWNDMKSVKKSLEEGA